MSGYSVNSFKGQIPKLASRLLQPEYAGLAMNTQMLTQELRPINKMMDAGVQFSEMPARIYAYYHPDTGDFEGWFWFPYYTDAFFNVLPNDTYNRVYFYDDNGELRISDADNFDVTAVDGSGHLIPSITNDWKLGVPQPSAPPTAVDAGGGTNIVEEDRAYVYTFVDHWGGEGPPSPPSPIVPGVAIDDTVDVSGFQSFPPDYNFDGGRYRIYRAVSGQVKTDYQFVGEVSSGTFSDNVPPQELGEIIPTRSWFPPPDEVQGMCLAANGTLVAFKDNTLYMSEPFMPSAWPPEYQNTVDGDVQAVAPTSASVVALTNDRPFMITGVIPNGVQIKKLDNEESCINKESVVTIGNMVYYASPNGISVVTQGQGMIASRDSMTREQWHNFDPANARAFSYDDKYALMYDTSDLSNTDLHGIEDPFAPQKGIWWMDNVEKFYKSWECEEVGIPVVKSDNETLYVVCEDMKLYELNPSPLTGGVPMMYTWRSKVFQAARPLNYSAFQVEADDYPLLASVYADGNRVFYRTILDANIVRLPSGFKARDWEVKLEGDVTVHSVHMYEAVMEVATV